MAARLGQLVDGCGLCMTRGDWPRCFLRLDLVRSARRFTVGIFPLCPLIQSSATRWALYGCSENRHRNRSGRSHDGWNLRLGWPPLPSRTVHYNSIQISYAARVFSLYNIFIFNNLLGIYLQLLLAWYCAIRRVFSEVAVIRPNTGFNSCENSPILTINCYNNCSIVLLSHKSAEFLSYLSGFGFTRLNLNL